MIVHCFVSGKSMVIILDEMAKYLSFHFYTDSRCIPHRAWYAKGSETEGEFRHSVFHFSPNCGGIVCSMAKVNKI